jgi:hypothetical protein
MENNFGLTCLSDHELKEFNGGMALSIIASFLASSCVNRIRDFIEGVKEGYARATQI